MSGRPMDYLLHLRLPFQLLLAPVFLWGALAAGGRWTPALAIAFVAVHVGLYGGATAFNSVYDRDEGPIGGLLRPPPVPRGLLPFSLLVLGAGALAAWWVGPAFAAVYLAMAALGLAYSWPPVRLKSKPWPSLLAVCFGQGLLAFLAGTTAVTRSWNLLPTHEARVVEAALVAMLVPTGLYPLTQVYQIEEDRRRGDRTFAVAYGPRACFGCALGGMAVSTLLLTRYAWRWFSAPEAALLAFGGAGTLLYLAAWQRRYDPRDVDGNYHRVMRVAALAALGIGALIVWRLGV